MSAQSLNRYSPVPPISPTQQPLDEKKMSSKKDVRVTQASDLNISGGAAVFSKLPIVKRQVSQSSLTARTAAADGKGTKVSDANCTLVSETPSNGEAAKEATTDVREHESVDSPEGCAVTTKDEDSSLALNDNATAAAAADDADDDDDDQSHCTSVSVILPLHYTVMTLMACV